MGDGRGFWSVGLFLLGLWGLSSLGLRGCFFFPPSLFGLLSGFSCLCFLWALRGPCCVLGAQEF